MAKSKTIAEYKKWIWQKYVSPYIRLENSKNGYVKCFTCGIIKPIKEIHAGHWRHGNTKRTYFFEKNIQPQCMGCNYFKVGARDIYAVKLEEKYGYGILQEIIKMDDPKFLWTKKKLKAVEEEYKQKLNDIQNDYRIRGKNNGKQECPY